MALTCLHGAVAGKIICAETACLFGAFRTKWATVAEAAPPQADANTAPPEATSDDSANATNHDDDLQRHFQRSLGAYPLRNKAPAALLSVRDASERNTDIQARNTGCAFVASAAGAGPKIRKQALRDDRAGCTAAERAEIANHTDNGSWELINRTDVPAGRAFVRLIWVYKRKCTGAS
eukprot:4512881-Pleurochrysis_carterae.AAC.2